MDEGVSNKDLMNPIRWSQYLRGKKTRMCSSKSHLVGSRYSVLGQERREGGDKAEKYSKYEDCILK